MILPTKPENLDCVLRNEIMYVTIRTTRMKMKRKAENQKEKFTLIFIKLIKINSYTKI